MRTPLCALATAATATALLGVVPTAAAPPAAAADTVPAFISSCTLAHTAGDDPIAMPGMPGMAMRHDFFGNTRTNANSTASSLLANDKTTCSNRDDTAAYWAPTATYHGVDVKPTRMRVYYRAGTKNPATVRPFPTGLKIIAGSAFTKSVQPTSVVSWGCGSASRGASRVPTCSGSTLVLHVYFPDCWDGKHLDSADHQSHMAYTHNGRCPSGHPVPVPKVTEDVEYPLHGGSGVAFDYSHNSITGHADFINSWKQSALTALVHTCIVGRRACGIVTS
jgi:Domain of unknown function (DUF1996)